jgi:hypothetical protein
MSALRQKLPLAGSKYFRFAPKNSLSSEVAAGPVRADIVAKVESCIGPNFWANPKTRSDQRFV